MDSLISQEAIEKLSSIPYAALMGQSVEFFTSEFGVKEGKVLYKALAIHKELQQATQYSEKPITDSHILNDYLRKHVRYYDDVEHFWIVPLNRKNIPLCKPIEVSVGGMTGTVVDVRVVAKRLVQINAQSFMVAHNHPSGNTRPSEGDKNLTTLLKVGLATLEITMLDHIILTAKDYYSFGDNGQI